MCVQKRKPWHCASVVLCVCSYLHLGEDLDGDTNRHCVHIACPLLLHWTVDDYYHNNSVHQNCVIVLVGICSSSDGEVEESFHIT